MVYVCENVFVLSQSDFMLSSLLSSFKKNCECPISDAKFHFCLLCPLNSVVVIKEPLE